MQVRNIKAFIPSKDFEQSKQFYTEIGFELMPVNDELALFQNGECLFFLQNFYQEALAENFMLQICVEDIQIAFELCSNSQHKSKISDISNEHWGKVFYLWGPSGELLHITQLHE
jgi:predicted lactoylglutathione lyase